MGLSHPIYVSLPLPFNYDINKISRFYQDRSLISSNSTVLLQSRAPHTRCRRGPIYTNSKCLLLLGSDNPTSHGLRPYKARLLWGQIRLQADCTLRWIVIVNCKKVRSSLRLKYHAFESCAYPISCYFSKWILYPVKEPHLITPTKPWMIL